MSIHATTIDMQNKIIIDQKRFLAYEELDIVDVAIYDLLQHFAKNIKNHTVHITAQEIINQLPLLRIKDRKAIYRRLKALERSGLIQMQKSKGNRYSIVINELREAMSIKDKYSFENLKRRSKPNGHEIQSVQASVLERAQKANRR